MLTPKNIQLDMLITKNILMVMFYQNIIPTDRSINKEYSAIFMINAIMTVTFIPKYYSDKYTMLNKLSCHPIWCEFTLTFLIQQLEANNHPMINIKYFYLLL